MVIIKRISQLVLLGIHFIPFLGFPRVCLVMVLAEHGQPDATIVVCAKASPAERTVANDMQAVLQKITEAVLPIVEDTKAPKGNRILIGNTMFTSAIVPSEEQMKLSEKEYIVRHKDGERYRDVVDGRHLLREHGRISEQINRLR